MAIIDSRKRTKNGKVIVTAVSESNTAKLAAARAKSEAQLREEQLKQARHRSNPLNWKRDPDVSYSLSGLGATRSYRRYPGKTFMMATAIWNESPHESERAARAALKAAAREKKNKNGAHKSL